MTAKTYSQIVEAIKGKAKDVVTPHSEMILFGSRARGNALKGSPFHGNVNEGGIRIWA